MLTRYRASRPGGQLTMLSAALVAAAMLTMTACGGSSEDGGVASAGEGTAKSSASANPDDQAVRFAQCMREHGVDMPDPKPGDNPGLIRMTPGSDTSPEEMEEARAACQEYLPAPTGDPQEMQDQMLKYAQCMRDHGIDMPDPEGGGIRMRVPKDQAESPEFKRAMEECSKYAPGRQGGQ
ncbi:MAG: hypothetical protein GEV03_16405 [Streptosporangiales bacterium]|nr:hypothetical protein [Streptosporangiales bacterium]